MYASLRPCPACDRHVRYADVRCPFCESDLPRAQAPKLADHSGLSRAARLAMGALLLAACASEPPPEPVAPVYGGPPSDEPGPDVPPAPEAVPDPAVPAPGPDEAPAAPLYGAPPPPEE